MARTRKDLISVVGIAKDVSLEQVLTSERPKKSSGGRSASFRRVPAWQVVALISMSFLLLITIGVAFYAFHRVGELNQELGLSVHRVEQKLQSLDAGISFDSKRQQLLIGIRDEIMKANPRVSLNQAYEYSRLILQASDKYPDKYPAVDPLIFLAVEIVESGYNPSAIGHQPRERQGSLSDMAFHRTDAGPNAQLGVLRRNAVRPGEEHGDGRSLFGHTFHRLQR